MFVLLWALLGLFVVLCYYGEREARRGRPHSWVLTVGAILVLLMVAPLTL